MRKTSRPPVEPPSDLPPVSVDDAWLCVDSHDQAHLFPAGPGPRSIRSICGKHLRTKATGRATAATGDLVAGARGEKRSYGTPENYRVYCPECLDIQEHRWLNAYPRGPVAGKAVAS